MSDRVIVVDATHWLDEFGDLPIDQPRVFRNALRMAQCIEYGGPLPKGHGVPTLIACRWRPGGTPCLGFLQVVKAPDGEIHASCPVCVRGEFFIRNWESTQWAEGPPPPIPVVAVDPDDVGVRYRKGFPKADVLPPSVRAELCRVLEQHPFTADEVVAMLAAMDHPAEVVQKVAGRCPPRSEGAMRALVSALMEAWNATPRVELDGRTPTEASGPEPMVAPPRVGRNEMCPCGSGKKYKRCCLH